MCQSVDERYRKIVDSGQGDKSAYFREKSRKPNFKVGFPVVAAGAI
jgi:hypothetical protein